MKQIEKSMIRFSGSNLGSPNAANLPEDIPKIGCVIMASGLSKRFGRNKLMAMYQGKSFIERALDLTEGLFEKRVVLTRSAEIIDTCKSHGVEVILHELEGRNDAVALGISEMQGMDACVFCPCDQPLLKRSSVETLTGAFAGSRENSIIRLSHENLDGTPVLFSKEYFEELFDLPEKKGGGYLAAKYPENVIRVQVTDPTELWDIDTEEDYKKLIAEY